MLNNNNLIKIGLLTALIAFGVIGVFAIGGMSVSSLVYGQQQSTRHFSLIDDTFSLGFRQSHSVRFNIDPAAENVVLSGQVQSKWCAIAHNRSICCGCKSMRPRNGSQFMSGSVFTF